MLAVAHVGVRKGATHSDDIIRPWHLQLEVGVVGDYHELDVEGRSGEDPPPQR